MLSIDSPSNITNLKNEIEKRQQERSSENDEEVKQGAIELPKDEAVAKAPAAAQSLTNLLFALQTTSTIKYRSVRISFFNVFLVQFCLYSHYLRKINKLNINFFIKYV